MTITNEPQPPGRHILIRIDEVIPNWAEAKLREITDLSHLTPEQVALSALLTYLANR